MSYDPASGGNGGEGVSTPADTPVAPVAPAEPKAAVLPQFGTVEHAAGDSTPAVSDAGGYVSAKPLLTTGAAGWIVQELAALLDKHGFHNAVHAGKAEAILDDALMGAVRAFQDAKGIDPSAQPSDGGAPLIPKSHNGIVDAKTWEALLGEAPAVLRTVRHVIEEVA